MNTIAKPVKIDIQGRRILYLCPKCKQSITFKKKIHGNSLCSGCGQRLDWNPAHDISIEVLWAEDSDEAAWIAKEYYAATGMKEDDWIDITKFRQSLRGDGVELYLLFIDKKAHGRFMRKYAKEGIIHDG